MAYEAQGFLGDAEAAAASAETCNLQKPYLTSRLAWSRGRIAHARRDLRSSEIFFRQALASLGAAVIDKALVGAGLVRVLLEGGRTRDACATAVELSPLVDGLTAHPMDLDKGISAAVFDLAWAGMQTKMTTEVVDRTLRAIERRRAAATARLQRDLHL